MHSFAAGDVSGHGLLDLVVGRADSVVVYRNGGGAFAPDTAWAAAALVGVGVLRNRAGQSAGRPVLVSATPAGARWPDAGGAAWDGRYE